METTTVARLTVVAGDPAASDEAAQKLMKELHDLPEIIAVEQATVPGPDNARSIDLVAVGTLLLTVAASPDVLGAVLTYLIDWLRRPGNNRGTIRVKIGDKELEVSNPTEADTKKIVDAFVRELRRR
ncbi:hypothetical protein AB0J80_27260 [Actinoplanes sp. NPDC049548]|uniref:hypothetical protein n=1 Tax=Actinoplanes sp. NPDC049548 TaxID=3155152 RepID=UPI00343C14D3